MTEEISVIIRVIRGKADLSAARFYTLNAFATANGLSVLAEAFPPDSTRLRG